jgi:hypothetical protein
MSLSLAQRTITGTINAAAWEIIAGTQGARIYEIGVSLVTATASLLAIGRPAAIGVTPTAPVLFEDANGASGIVAGAVAWGTPPTAPVRFVRRVSLPAAVDTHVFEFWSGAKRGLTIPAGGSLVVWNLAANSILDVWAVLDQ